MITKKQAIAMIDEYLLEPNNISKEWVECLRLCRGALAPVVPRNPTCNDCIHQKLCNFYATEFKTDRPADDIEVCELFEPKTT